MTGESGTSHTMKVHRYYKCFHTRKPKTCTKKNVKKDWIEDLVISETMKIVFDEALMEYLADMLMEAQKKENTRLPALKQQLAKVEQGIQNLVNAIEQGIISPSTKKRLDELEDTKSQLETAILREEVQQVIFTREQILFFLHHFRSLDISQLDHRRQLIDTFVNAIYLYDDKVILTFNYKEGAREITLDDVNSSGLVTQAAPWRGRQVTPYKAPSKEGALPLYKILATAWSLSIQSVLHRHGVAAEARPTCPPLSRGALPLYKILAGTWSPKHPKCFTPTNKKGPVSGPFLFGAARRDRQGLSDRSTRKRGPSGPPFHTFSPA